MITLALGTFQVSQKYLGLLPEGGSYTVKVLLINAHAEKKKTSYRKRWLITS